MRPGALPSAFQEDDTAHNDDPGSVPPLSPTAQLLESVIKSGHRGLRFPKHLETEFQQEALPSREKLHGWCGVLGLAGFWFGSRFDFLLAPESASVMAYARPLMALFMAASFVVFLLPTRAKKAWYLEACMLANTRPSSGLAWSRPHPRRWLIRPPCSRLLCMRA